MTDTPQHLVLWPMITLVAITFVVAVRMFFVRIGEMRGPEDPASVRCDESQGG